MYQKIVCYYYQYNIQVLVGQHKLHTQIISIHICHIQGFVCE